MACPYCEQGALYRITIVIIGIDSFICDECDTVWLTYDQVGSKTGTFVEYLINWIGSNVSDYKEELAYHEVHKWPNDNIDLDT